MNSELWLQVSAGQGPAECALAVVKVIDEILRDAASKGIACRLIEAAPGLEPGTANSALLSIEGETLIVDSFAAGWEGTVQWTARSPLRPAHKRKNWFVGIEAIRPLDDSAPSLDSRRDVRWETMRAAGPGGQHVNRTESAVRVTHLSTGISATASEERSQHRNRKLALARLASKLAERSQAARREQQTERWRAHQELERGNPVRVLRG